MQQDHRQILESLYQAALDRVAGAAAVRHQLERDGLQGDVALIAIGKAASSMTHGALDVLGEQLTAGLVITKHAHLSERCRLDERLTCLQSSHPVPDETTLRAGDSLLDFIAAQPRDRQLLVLVSGGASSLVDVLPSGYGLDELSALNQWLLSRHLDIGRMNAIRRGISCIKGGRLASYLQGRRTRLLLISDVPGDEPWVIGSGLLVPPGPAAPLPDDLPDWVHAMISAAPPLPAEDDPAFATIRRTIVASNSQARAAVVRKAEQLGLPVVAHDALLEGDALEAAERIAHAVLHGPVGIQVWGGEPTVALPDKPGRGGRAQALALRAAMIFEGGHDVWLLAAGTDGTDGPGEDAGAIVDNMTCQRGRQAGLDPDDCLDAADSGTFLDASGDLLRTGPTGTNVMDVVISLKVSL